MQGPHVYLRRMTVDDVDDQYLSWFRDEQVTAFLEARDLSRDDVVAHLQAGIESGSYTMYAIVDRKSDLHIGNIKLGPVLSRHMISDLSIVIGRREFWGKGLASEAISLATEHAFGELGYRKLCAGAIEGNGGSLKAFERAGWVVEARMRGHCLWNGETRDRIVLACFNPAFFELDDTGFPA